MQTLKQRMHCTRRLALFAVYDVLDRLKSDYAPDGNPGEIRARISVFENFSEFLISVTEDGELATLCLSVISPAEGLSPEGQSRALGFLADSVVQHIENEFQIEKIKAEALHKNKGGTTT